jgi:hypothetical protein
MAALQAEYYYGGGGLLAAGGRLAEADAAAGLAGALAASEAGMTSLWPTWILSGSLMLLARAIASTLVPFSAAIRDRVSPDLTV